MKAGSIASFVVATLASSTAAQQTPPAAVESAPVEARRALLGPMANDLLDRVGSWNVRADVQLQPGGRRITIAARAVSRLVGGRWLVSELRGAEGGPGMAPFEGLGVNGYDSDTGHYVGYWIDGSRGIVVPVEGHYDQQTQVFATTSQERRADGSTVTVRSETRRTGPDSEVTVFTAPDKDGRPYVRMILTYTRARAVH